MNSIEEMVVKHSKATVPLGTLLAAHKLILLQDLDFALEHQKFSRQLLGEILVRIGALEQADLDRILELQCSIDEIARK
jgi:hypothetical protein